MNMRTWRYPLIALMCLILAILACNGEETSGKKVGEDAGTSEEAAPSATKPAQEIFVVGDVIAVQDHSITLNSAKIKGGVLTAIFTVENQGDEEIVVSSLLSFNARNDDGTQLDTSIFDCEGGGLDGTVLAGDKLKGSICWKDADPPCRIYYEASLFGKGAVVWEVDGS